MAQTSSPVYYTRRLRLYVKELWRRREFAWFLATGNLKARNASTTLGLFWWVLNPMLLSLVYWLIFGLVFPGRRDIIYVMSGMFAFHFTTQSLSGGASAILRNSRLLINLRFPRLILPLTSILESLVGFIVSLGVLLATQFLLEGDIPGRTIGILVVVMPLHFIFNLGLAAMAGRLSVPFRDINNFIPYLTRIWLYLSPIIWPLDFLDSDTAADFAQYADDNPMFAIIGLYRAALLGDRFDFDPSMLTQLAIWAGVVGIIGVAMFIRNEGKIARYL